MSSGASKVVPVSELFNRLAAEYRSAGIPQAQLFQTALRVCAEESKRSRLGESPAQLAELVGRARAVLESSHPRPAHRALADWPVGASAVATVEERPAPPAQERTQETTPPTAAPFDAQLAPAAPDPEVGETQISFEDVFRHEAETTGAREEEPERGGGISFSVVRIAMAAVAVLAAVVVIVILWPGLTASKIAQPATGTAATADGQTKPAGHPRAVVVTPPHAETAPAALASTTAAAPAALHVTPAASEPTVAPQQHAATATNTPLARREVVDGVEVMRSPDWAGRAPAFVVHFASYRSRENATADAAKLGHDLGRSAYVLLVDLGDKGMWYRVVVGGFATAAEARAFRAEVAAAKTREVGGVYRLAAP